MSETEPKVEPSSLHMKLAAILGKVGNIPKTGFNAHHNYNYVQEADVLDALRPQLAEAGISSIVAISTYDVRDCKTAAGTDTRLTTVQGAIVFTDSETRENLIINIVGQGMDAQDKGLPKAITMAVKYGLLKSFLIGTGDDAERVDGPTQAPAARSAAPSPPPAAAAAAPTTTTAPVTERLPWETEEEAAAAAAAAAATPDPAPAPAPAARSQRGSAPGGNLISEAQGRLLYGRAKGLKLTDEQRTLVIQNITGQPEIDAVTWDKMDAILEGYAAMAEHGA